MKLVEAFLTRNPCFRAGRKIVVKGLMLHSVGCPQPRASVFIGNWNQESFDDACVHAFIDGNEGTVYQTWPWNHRGWHCASGISGNHGDPEHLWRQLGLEYTMEGFRRDVKAAMGAGGYPEKLTDGYYYVRKAWEDKKSQKGAYKILKNAKACADRNAGYVVFDGDGNVVYGTAEKRPEDVTDPGDGTVAGEKKVAYRVRVRIPDLNIRKGPETNYEKTGKFTGVGVFSIVAEAAGEGAKKWGKLRSGAGWISMEYGERV